MSDRRFDGPVTVRELLRSPTGWVWLESKRGGSGTYLDAAAMRSLAARLGPGWGVPTIVDDTAVHPAVTRSGRLVDELLGDEDLPETEDALAAVGRRLAQLHAVGPAGLVLPRRSSRPPWADALPHLARGVLDRATDLRAVMGVPEAPSSAEVGLVHGHPSLGCMSADVPRLLGWREAGIGPRELDIALPLSECAEIAAERPRAAARCRRAARAFLAGWRAAATVDVEPAALLSAAASRTAQHLALRDLSYPDATHDAVEHLARRTGEHLAAFDPDLLRTPDPRTA